MNKPKPLPSLSELQEVFTVTDKYPSGLCWKINPSQQGGRKADSMAGYLPKKGPQYWRVKYKQKLYPCHRIVWSLKNNKLILPEEYVDHVDLNTKDNRGELRLVTRSQNQYNRRAFKNKSGYRWVVYSKNTPNKPWKIIMRINGKLEYFGYYSSAIEAAKEADAIAVKRLENGYIRLNFPELKSINTRIC